MQTVNMKTVTLKKMNLLDARDFLNNSLNFGNKLYMRVDDIAKQVLSISDILGGWVIKFDGFNIIVDSKYEYRSDYDKFEKVKVYCFMEVEEKVSKIHNRYVKALENKYLLKYEGKDIDRISMRETGIVCSFENSDFDSIYLDLERLEKIEIYKLERVMNYE